MAADEVEHDTEELTRLYEHVVENEEADPLTSNLSAIEPTNPFNTTRGASEALGGVFRFPKAEIWRILLGASRRGPASGRRS